MFEIFIIVFLIILLISQPVGKFLVKWAYSMECREKEERLYKEQQLSSLKSISKVTEGLVQEPSVTERLLEANKELLQKQQKRQDIKAIEDLIKEVEEKS